MEGTQAASWHLLFPMTARTVPAWRLADKGKPVARRGRKATGLAPSAIDGGASQPGCRSQEVGVATARLHLVALVRVVAVMSLALAGVATVRPI